MPANVEKMALIGQPSWHGLEEVMPEGATLAQWKKTGGLSYRVEKVPVHYQIGPTFHKMDERCVLYRDDTSAALSVVGADYNVVQPAEVVDFFQDLITRHNFKMETAGCLAGGRKVWALARTGHETAIGGYDLVKQYLLLATSYDTSMETTAKQTNIRVVCQNTLSASLRSGEPAVTVNHRSVFNEQQVKIDLGLLTEEFEEFGALAERMHAMPIKKASKAAKLYAELVTGEENLTDEQVLKIGEDSRLLPNLMQTFREGKGAEPTLWGWVNGVTAYVDHLRGRTPESGLNSAWFGSGAKLKEKAWQKATELVT